MRTLWASVALLSFVSCSHPKNAERRDPLNDQVSGAIQPTDRAFLKDDPASSVACRGDAQCPPGALCYPVKNVCFTPQMPLTKLETACPLVPLYFAVDSTVLVPDAQFWIVHDAACLKTRGAKRVELEGFADARGEPGYNDDLSRRRAEVVKAALEQHGLTVDVAVVGEGATDPVLTGTSEHDYAYNRRVELKTK
jgi:outer membrane protein OmpA-like peptidoglycan-associated protein